MIKKKFYAYKIDKEQGVTSSWDECAAIVGGESGAKYKGFETYNEAAAWLVAGADYSQKHFALENGIYFDAGTGGGNGVEINVPTRAAMVCFGKFYPNET